MAMRTAKMSAKTIQGARFSPVTSPRSALGAPSSAITWEKIEAKMMMSMMNAVVRTVSWKARSSPAQVRRPTVTARTRLTETPSAAASVGVTIPRYIEPSTTAMRSTMGATSTSERSLCDRDAFPSAPWGARSGNTIA